MHLKVLMGISLATVLLTGAGCATEPSVQPAATIEPVEEATADEGTTDTTKKNVTVLFTNDGYVPASTTVAAGTSVTFVNASAKDMWPASAMHPTHREYPTTGGCLGSTFDACARIKPGQSWSFTFDITGTWKFHDHLSPTFFGSITVE